MSDTAAYDEQATGTALPRAGGALRPHPRWLTFTTSRAIWVSCRGLQILADSGRGASSETARKRHPTVRRPVQSLTGGARLRPRRWPLCRRIAGRAARGPRLTRSSRSRTTGRRTWRLPDRCRTGQEPSGTRPRSSALVMSAVGMIIRLTAAPKSSEGTPLPEPRVTRTRHSRGPDSRRRTSRTGKVLPRPNLTERLTAPVRVTTVLNRLLALPGITVKEMSFGDVSVTVDVGLRRRSCTATRLAMRRWRLDNRWEPKCVQRSVNDRPTRCPSS